jgi:hypothetical protein
MGRTVSTEPQCLYRGALYLTFYREVYITSSDLNIWAADMFYAEGMVEREKCKPSPKDN